MQDAPHRLLPLLTRRRFVHGLAGGFALAGAARALGAPGVSAAGELSGTDFELEIGERQVNLTGRPRTATVVNGSLPGPVLRWREGDTVTLRVRNRLAVPSSIHWHGIVLPTEMDGVPNLSFPGIPPGGSYTYRFTVRQSGTYWYHAHSGFQEQTGLYGAIVITPRAGERHAATRDHVVLLSDWTDIDPGRIYRLLKADSGYFNYGRRTLGSSASGDWAMWARMRMDPTDLADVSGAAYTYLVNGVPPGGNWTGIAGARERVRLRFVNGSSMSFFDVRIPGLPLTVVAADGQDVEPVTVDEFRLGTAETLDVLVTPPDDGPYAIFAQSIDRTGFASGTLASRQGLRAPLPAPDPRSQLSMADMAPFHAMAGMAHGAAAHDMSAMGHDMPHHAPAEYGPTVDMLAMAPWSRLDDPGIGLRGNGRRVLTYADLRTLGGSIDPRPPGREIELHLTGHMMRYLWSFSGRSFAEAEPLRFALGERLRIVLVNDTMMNHPIHLHGMWSEILTDDDRFQVRKHTLIVQPGQRIAYGVTADAAGRWAYHCHLLYHMEAGMFREVVVAPAGGAAG